jgi:hypothetical protein
VYWVGCVGCTVTLAPRKAAIFARTACGEILFSKPVALTHIVVARPLAHTMTNGGSAADVGHVRRGHGSVPTWITSWVRILNGFTRL